MTMYPDPAVGVARRSLILAAGFFFCTVFLFLLLPLPSNGPHAARKGFRMPSLNDLSASRTHKHN